MDNNPLMAAFLAAAAQQPRPQPQTQQPPPPIPQPAHQPARVAVYDVQLRSEVSSLRNDLRRIREAVTEMARHLRQLNNYNNRQSRSRSRRSRSGRQ